MEKQNKIILSLVMLFTLVIIGICVFAIKNRDEIVVTDAIKFKEEYESINGSVNENNGKTYLNLSISTENPVVYKSDTEIVDIMKNEQAIIYFGFSKCPWCRSIIETLLKACEQNNIKTLYYVDIYNIRDTYKINDSKKIEKINKGTEGYKDILKFFGKKLDDYTLTDNDGNEYSTKTTRLYAPTVVTVDNGAIKDIHVSTVESQIDPYSGLNDDQKGELYTIYDNMIKSLKGEDVCKTSSSC